jgi:hypothetical protein
MKMKKEMKKVLFLVLVYLCLIVGVRSVNAQVAIGNLQDPHSGAVLDLSQVSKQNPGLLLPRVSLTKTNEWQLNGNSVNGIGMLVYNMNGNLVNGRGIYLWNGAEWEKIDDILVTGFKVTPAGATNKSVTWKIINGNDVIELSSISDSSCTIRGLKAGSAQILITSKDGNKSETVNIIVKAPSYAAWSTYPGPNLCNQFSLHPDCV